MSFRGLIAFERTDHLTGYTTQLIKTLVRRALQSDGHVTITKGKGDAHVGAPRFKPRSAGLGLIAVAGGRAPLSLPCRRSVHEERAAAGGELTGCGAALGDSAIGGGHADCE